MSDLERMAVEAGLGDEMWFGKHTPEGYEDCMPKLERFAASIRADERAMCSVRLADLMQRQQTIGRIMAVKDCIDALKPAWSEPAGHSEG